MKYASNAPKVIKHEIVLEDEDVAEAIHAYLTGHPDIAPKLAGVTPSELGLYFSKQNGTPEISVAWETELKVESRPPQPAQGMTGDGVTPDWTNTSAEAGGDRPGKFAVISDDGDRPRTGEIAARFDEYEAADTYRFEQPNLSDRASIVWVVKSGSRYQPDKRTFARDEEDDEEKK